MWQVPTMPGQMTSAVDAYKSKDRTTARGGGYPRLRLF